MQAYNAFPWLTVRQNIAFGLVDQPDQNQAIERWL
jgi:ABC-type sulfate/molybdate transport systems ATPase subunit